MRSVVRSAKRKPAVLRPLSCCGRGEDGTEIKLRGLLASIPSRAKQHCRHRNLLEEEQAEDQAKQHAHDDPHAEAHLLAALLQPGPPQVGAEQDQEGRLGPLDADHGFVVRRQEVRVEVLRDHVPRIRVDELGARVGAHQGPDVSMILQDLRLRSRIQVVVVEGGGAVLDALRRPELQRKVGRVEARRADEPEALEVGGQLAVFYVLLLLVYESVILGTTTMMMLAIFVPCRLTSSRRPQ